MYSILHATIKISSFLTVVPEENVATPHRDACTIEGQVKESLLNGDTENYNGENGYTTHTITRDRSKGITVQLNQPYNINCISLLLWDKDNRCERRETVIVMLVCMWGKGEEGKKEGRDEGRREEECCRELNGSSLNAIHLPVCLLAADYYI